MTLPREFEARLSHLSVLVTILWVPSIALLLLYKRLLLRPLPLVLLLVGLVHSVVVVSFPIALRIDEQRVEGTWLWGRRRVWELSALRLDASSSLYSMAFGGRQVRASGKTVFLVWAVMSHSEELLARLEAMDDVGSREK